MKDKKNSWFRRHWILTGILGFLILSSTIGIIQGISNSIGDEIKYADYSENGLVVVNSNLLIPQDSEIDRIWNINDMVSITTNATGFTEGTERRMNKREDFGGSSVIVKAYHFDSDINSNQFYNEEKQKIDIRGVKDWNLEEDCFGINIESLLSGYTEGLCLRDNVVFYIKSSSTSYSYASDGKDFMKMMLKKV